MIRVLVVEDSAVVRTFLLHILGSNPEIEIAGTAENGEDAVEAVARLKPDVITMDVHMPRLNGFDATRRIMETRPTPIVIVSGSPDVNETAKAFRALEAGALAVLPRPAGIGHAGQESGAADLVQTVKLMAEVKVVRRWARPKPEDVVPADSLPPERRVPGAGVAVVAVGASTGGPAALQCILSALPKSLPVPILVVQHIAPGFTEGFVEWLGHTSNLPVHVPAQGHYILPGHVYVAPEGLHMEVAMGGQIRLTQKEFENGLRPSVSYLFRSVARVYGGCAVGILLTGMGKDGAEELKQMRKWGAITIAQDRESSVVYGMPGEAMRLGAARYVLCPDQISAMLESLAGVQPMADQTRGR